MKLKDVEFAPLCVPFRRRLETLAAAAWIYLVVLGGVTGWAVLLYILVATRFWWLSVLYLAWIYHDRSVGSSNKIRCVSLKKTDDFPHKKRAVGNNCRKKYQLSREPCMAVVKHAAYSTRFKRNY